MLISHTFLRLVSLLRNSLNSLLLRCFVCCGVCGTPLAFPCSSSYVAVGGSSADSSSVVFLLVLTGVVVFHIPYFRGDCRVATFLFFGRYEVILVPPRGSPVCVRGCFSFDRRGVWLFLCVRPCGFGRVLWCSGGISVRSPGGRLTPPPLFPLAPLQDQPRNSSWPAC